MTTTVAYADLPSLVGTDLGYSDWLDITQERVDTFADATGDHQWIHTDPERAKDGPFGAPIAHGFLTLSLLIPLWSELLEVEGAGTKVNYGLDKVRFVSPVPVGSRIRLTGTIAEITEVGGGYQLVVDITIETEGGAKPAVVARSLQRLYAA
ncbi:MaoC family dehydratase [Microbacterium sp. zg.Y909]|uniref:MaoC family dehydratase n=1 Tax=Microbacterium sp. zg.Y909 TaxID=2969413 RepID=UPI00214C8BB8|nr:MaoC family dehydratase [Microbacterium sp. zg.Y909]MCR2824346.1 MaoC family dehydratase [Microbacterium sp. zg.Y909]